VPGLVWYAALGCVVSLGLAAFGLFSSDHRLSPPGVRAVAILLGAGGFLTLWSLLRVSWLSHWQLTVNSQGLTARSWITRQVRSISWDRIDAVSGERPTWSGALVRLRLNVIEVSDSAPIFFGTHLLGYHDFLEWLRTHATSSRRFTPHPNGLLN
jgi:hypothetical protein